MQANLESRFEAHDSYLESGAFFILLINQFRFVLN